MFTFKMKTWKWIAILLIIYVALFYAAFLYAKTPDAKPIKTLKTEYKYKLILKIDFKKRDKILKDNGEPPTIYDKALSFIKSDIHAANVIDIVENNGTTMKLSSVISPTTILSYALGDKTLRRDSLSTQNKSGFISTSYAEKRGNSPRTTAKTNYLAAKVSFYDGTQLKNVESIKHESFDMLSIIYEGVGLSSKAKTYLVNNSRSLMPMHFEIGEIWDISVNNKKHKAIRYYKKITKSDTATFEIWIDEERKIPLRYQIGLSDKYGVTMLFELSSYNNLN